MKKLIPVLLITISFFSGCNRPDINDPSKRNENWVWWVDKTTGVGKWIRAADQTTVKNGDYTTFYSNGKTYAHGRLKDGKTADTTFYYNYEGALIRYTTSTDTIGYFPINGKFIDYFQTGEINAVGSVDNHGMEKQWTFYYKNGSLKSRVEFKENMMDGNVSNWYENGQLKAKSNFTNGKLNGQSVFYFENGNMKRVLMFKNDTQDGPQVLYYQNGNVMSQYSIIKGAQDGIATYYYENGMLRGISNWLDDIEDGQKKLYYKNGQLGAIGMKKNGHRIGLWQYYDSTGKKLDSFPEELGKVTQVSSK